MEMLGVTPDLGAPASNVKRLSALDVHVEYSSGKIDDLMGHLARDIPCIVFVDTAHLSYWSEATRHTVVVAGIDEHQAYLYDPFFDAVPQTVSRLEFELAWDEMDNTYAIITH